MGDQAELEKAFDAALAQVERLLRAGTKTVDGASARPQLEELAKELKRERANVLQRRATSRDWIQKTVRSVVVWIPDDELKLVAALGGIVRAAPSTAPSP
jgi:hypothetical protein